MKATLVTFESGRKILCGDTKLGKKQAGLRAMSLTKGLIFNGEVLKTMKVIEFDENYDPYDKLPSDEKLGPYDDMPLDKEHETEENRPDLPEVGKNVMVRGVRDGDNNANWWTGYRCADSSWRMAKEPMKVVREVTAWRELNVIHDIADSDTMRAYGRKLGTEHKAWHIVKLRDDGAWVTADRYEDPIVEVSNAEKL